MKKLTTLILALVLLIPVSVSAKKASGGEVPQYQIEGAGMTSQSAQQVLVTIITKKKDNVKDIDLEKAAVHGVLFRDYDDATNAGFGSVAGYRFNEYVRVGLGLGARYYFDNNKVRSTLSEWAFPIFLNVRGNFIPTRYRDVVPYYSFDIGGTVRDGFMLRPTVGLRVGRERSAFLVGLGYVGQDLSTYSRDNLRKTRRFVNFITLKLGYEF